MSFTFSPHWYQYQVKRKAFKTTEERERIVKCHPYLWLAPHLPLVPCLNPQSACYIYIVVREFFLFFFSAYKALFIWLHTQKSGSLQIASRKFLGKIPPDIFFCLLLFFFPCRLYYSTSNLKDSSLVFFVVSAYFPFFFTTWRISRI